MKSKFIYRNAVPTATVTVFEPVAFVNTKSLRFSSVSRNKNEASNILHLLRKGRLEWNAEKINATDFSMKEVWKWRILKAVFDEKSKALSLYESSLWNFDKAKKVISIKKFALALFIAQHLVISFVATLSFVTKCKCASNYEIKIAFYSTWFRFQIEYSSE